jgi:hypothetical protein
MNAAATQPDAPISHGEVESQLRVLHVGQIDRLWGHLVWKVDRLHYRVDGGELMTLLVAIDALMKWRGHVIQAAAAIE